MKTYKVEAIVLKRQNISEADKILTIFSKEKGKIKVLAKGVRKISSRRAGGLELFNHVSLVICEGKGLDSVSEANILNNYVVWRKDLRAVGVAFYLCELVDRLTVEGQDHDEVFNLLLRSLEKNCTKNARKTILVFEEELLKHLGFGVPNSQSQKNKSLKDYIELITEKTIVSPKIIKEIW